MVGRHDVEVVLPARSCQLASAQECADDLSEVFEIGGRQAFVDWQKERLFAIENAGFDPVFLDERF
jgi:hypothetical protein